MNANKSAVAIFNLPVVYKGTGIFTETNTYPNLPWPGCLPNPLIETIKSPTFTFEADFNSDILVPGAVSGTAVRGPSTKTLVRPDSLCPLSGSSWTTVVGYTGTSSWPGGSRTISGNSNGTQIVIDRNPSLPSYCTETFTGNLSTAPVTGIVQLSAQDTMTCISNGQTQAATITYSLTRQ